MVTWPLTLNQIRKGSPRNTFGMVRRYKNGKPKPHQGWDFIATIGTPVYAIGSGNVLFVRHGGKYGVQLCHSFVFRGRRLYAFYAHLQGALVRKGDWVDIDQHIARTGVSGDAEGLSPSEHHLHFEVREHMECVKGLAGRLSPQAVFGRCPLAGATYGGQTIA